MNTKIVISVVILGILIIGSFSLWNIRQNLGPDQQQLKQPMDQKQQRSQEQMKEGREEKIKPDEMEVDNWKIFRDEKHDYELKYPETWVVDASDGSKIFIYSSTPREEMPEGGSALIIEVRQDGMQDFIKEYNTQGGAHIVNEKASLFGNLSATELEGTTDIGINWNFVFVSHNNKNYLISYHDFDPYHHKILSSFTFLN